MTTLRRLSGVAASLIAVIALDAVLGGSAVVVGLLVVGPLIAAARMSAIPTATVALLALTLAIVSGAIDGRLLEAQQSVSSGVVLCGGIVAIWMSTIHMRLVAAQRTATASIARSRLLAATGTLLDAAINPAEMLTRLARLPLPDMADLCIIDRRESDRIVGAGVAATEPGIAKALVGLRSAYPLDPDGPHPVARALRTGDSALLARMSESQLADFAQSDEHRRFMVAADYHSALVVPLRARGRILGVISMLWLTDSRSYDERDLELVEELASRAALALDNARLLTEVQGREAEVTAILHGVSEAVVAVNADGSIRYANDAAAQLVGVESPAELVGGDAVATMARLDPRDSSGAELDPETIARRGLPGHDQEPLVVRMTANGEERWVQPRTTLVRDDDANLVMSVNVLEDVTATKRVELEQRFLAEASRLLSASLDTSTTFQQIAQLVVPRIADWCVVELPHADGELEVVGLAHRDPKRVALVRELRARFPLSEDEQIGAPVVIRTGLTEVNRNVTAEMIEARTRDLKRAKLVREIGLCGSMVVPIAVPGRVLGAITLASTRPEFQFGAHEQALAEELGRRAGAAIENARLYGERAWIAETLQASLLPPELPAVPGMRVATRFRAAGEGVDVGGDFYDLFPVPGGWLAAIGDVTGKGPAAAAITALARHALRTVAHYESEPAVALARLNELLREHDRPYQLCSAICARLTPTADGVSVRFASGGHPLPVLVEPSGAIRRVGEPGMLLGAGAATRNDWPETEVNLADGELLVLYTDGVTDASREGARFGDERLLEVLSGCGGVSANELAGVLDDAVRRWERGAQRDDVALVVIESRPQAPGLRVVERETG